MVGATGDLARGAAAREDRDRPRASAAGTSPRVDVVALVYLGLVVVRPVLERAIVLCSARAGERFLGDLRVAAYDKLQELSLPFFEETRAGVLVSRLTADVQTLTTFTRQVLVEVVGSVLLFVVTLVILVTLSPLLSLVMLVSVPLLAWSSLRYGKRSRPAFLALRDRVADTMTSLQEGLDRRARRAVVRPRAASTTPPTARARARRSRRGGGSRSSTSASSR